MIPYQQPDASRPFRPLRRQLHQRDADPRHQELKDAYARYQHDPEFMAEFHHELAHFVGRPSPIYHAARMSREQGGAQIFLKREDLNHTGAHKINNTIGQAMLARRMGKPRVIAETGAGQHGVATATICARYGLECVVYMGSEDVKRQSPNVYRMKLLGAKVVPVESGQQDAEGRAERSHARLGRQRRQHLLHHRHRGRPPPLPDDGARLPERHRQGEPRADAGDAGRAGCRQQPDVVVACVGGGSNAMGIFHPYITHEGHAPDRRRGRGRRPGQRQALRVAATWQPRRAAWQPHLHPAGRTARSPRPTASAPGWTTPASARSTPGSRTSAAPSTSASPMPRRSRPSTTCAAPKASSRRSSPATPWPTRCAGAKTMRPDQSILVNLSGRGDKDIGTVADLSHADFYCRPSCRGQAVKGGVAVKPVAGVRA
jgi:tryptophan synthase beta chain